MSNFRAHLEIVSQEPEYYIFQQSLRAKNDLIEDLQSQIAKLNQELKIIKLNKMLQRNEIYVLKTEAQSYQKELGKSKFKAQNLKTKSLQETSANNIGKEVRIRYFERHRQTMGKSIDKVDYDHIKFEDRAAHRERSLVNTWLYQTRQMFNQNVYKDLYRITSEEMWQWRDISEIVEISEFHASLQSEYKLSNRFWTLFDQFLKATATYYSLTELQITFAENKVLQYKQNQLQDCYDEIIAANASESRTTAL